MLIGKFKRFKEVSEIWCNNKKEYFIILDNEKYNFDLMHKFFAIEKENINMFKNIYYVPSLLFDRNCLYGYKRVY